MAFRRARQCANLHTEHTGHVFGLAMEVMSYVARQSLKVCQVWRCCVLRTDLRISNVMELNTKDKTHADSTMEASLSQNDLAGREAALSFSGEEMTKAAKKRYPFCWLLWAFIPSIASHLAVGGRKTFQSHTLSKAAPATWHANLVGCTVAGVYDRDVQEGASQLTL